MQLPQKLESLNQADRQALGEFYNLYSGKQWFGRAEIIENHQTQMRKTLELIVNYPPLLEMKEILTFAQKYNLAVETIVPGNNS